MRTLNFKAYVDAPGGLTGSAFFDAFEDPLFERFEGDVSPAVVVGKPLVGGYLGTVEKGEDPAEPIIRRVRALAELGLSVRTFEVIDVEEEEPVSQPSEAT